ncbi:hypothetical protein BBP00_00001456 [Phytophthora kernoviae]|uniref:Protein kinase domain-containing protein n=1 Tax=Phytophthora kernoviae TaxID=325452 RepID=A0A3F2S1L1_9STRA|nr:hypothetical protein BBP00_00001456 [Phytophthora kernoviae]
MTLLETVKTGDLGAIEQELDHGADVNEADNMGYTPLMWVIKNNREDIVRLLLDKNATLDLSNRSSQSALNLAIGTNILPILQEYQLERQRTIMDSLPDLCAGMVEVRQMSEHILERLQEAQRQVDGLEGDISASCQTSLFQVTGIFQFLLQQHCKKLILERLVSTRTVVSCLRELHCDIDALMDQVAPGLLQGQPWQDRWSEEEAAVNENLVVALENDAGQLQQELNITSLQEGALKLLKYESEEHEQHYSSRMIQVLEAVQSKLLRLSGLSVPEVPSWFIPEYEVQRHPESFAHGAFGKVYRGTWLESQVVVKCVDANSVEDKRTFRREAKTWQKARHRHIVNFFGACDQGSPWFFVCEEAANGNLKNYLYRQKKVGRSLAWRKLYEAALGLHFLHKRNIIHNDLKCNQILVSAEGVAMLTDFGLSFMSADSRPNVPPGGTVRWKAPECLAKADIAPTPESDVYSLGMCVVEAVTGGFPWGKCPDLAIMFQVRRGVPLPKPKEFESDEQWKFVKALCAFDPKKRMKLPDAIRVLKKFADQELDQELQNRRSSEAKKCHFTMDQGGSKGDSSSKASADNRANQLNPNNPANTHEKKDESIFTKAMGAAEKYHVKEQAVKYAQKRVDERKKPENQHSGEKKDGSMVDKARVAAEDFLAKQEQPKPQHTEEKKDNQMGDMMNKAKEAMGKYSKKH